ncbi:hypothetical protein [Pandoraea terrigena]|uniref:Transmembrane protein n=1 Tax=Pandoraea terrigena TaxID=2508292 RepID=A0A5E4URQ6_9BURK|nr:hypothetical protein [Pandoraea terrigena]VVE01689.1 hypothetical protein PTE31013_02176 [Pandoraea terrigena]
MGTFVLATFRAVGFAFNLIVAALAWLIGSVMLFGIIAVLPGDLLGIENPRGLSLAIFGVILIATFPIGLLVATNITKSAAAYRRDPVTNGLLAVERSSPLSPLCDATWRFYARIARPFVRPVRALYLIVTGVVIGGGKLILALLGIALGIFLLIKFTSALASAPVWALALFALWYFLKDK